VHPRLPWPFCWKLRHFINANANPVAKDQLADPAATADASASASPDASDDPASSADPIERRKKTITFMLFKYFIILYHQLLTHPRIQQPGPAKSNQYHCRRRQKMNTRILRCTSFLSQCQIYPEFSYVPPH
jgi:hypothetical protein